MPTPIEKKRSAWEAFRQIHKDNPEFMTLDELRDHADRQGIEFAWIKRRTELLEDLKKGGANNAD